VHGFQNSSGKWQTVSPSYSAELVYGWHVSGQEQPAGALTYDDTQIPNRLYYRGKEDGLYYFLVNTLIDYYYFPCPANSTVLSILKIQGNIAIHYDAAKRESRIYFVGRWSDGSLWVYYLVDDGSSWCGFDPLSWSGGSPTFAAIPNGYPITEQQQSIPAGEIAVSPNGNTVAIFSGTSVCFYYDLDGTNYALNIAEISSSTFYLQCLHFLNDNDLFFISSIDYDVHHLMVGEAFCENPSIRGIEFENIFYYP
jgi:hypothetical protein